MSTSTLKLIIELEFLQTLSELIQLFILFCQHQLEVLLQLVGFLVAHALYLCAPS